MKRPPLSLVLTLLLAVAIAAATLAPIGKGPGGIPGSDKAHHLLAFAVLAFPLAFARPRWIPAVALVLAAYGGAIELVQPFFGRGRELADWIADLAGIGIGAAAGLGLNRLVARRMGCRAHPAKL